MINVLAKTEFPRSQGAGIRLESGKCFLCQIFLLQYIARPIQILKGVTVA